MVHAAAVLVAAAGLAGSARAAAVLPPSFEGSLEAGRQAVLSVRARQAAEKRAKDADGIAAADKNVRTLTALSWQLRQRLEDVRRRARARASRPPGTPDNDPFLADAVSQLVFDIRLYPQLCEEVRRELEQLADGSQRDPSLVAAARTLSSDAQDLRSETGWLANDSRDGAWDLRAAGFLIEAADVQNAGAAAYQSAQDIASSARDVQERVSE